MWENYEGEYIFTDGSNSWKGYSRFEGTESWSQEAELPDGRIGEIRQSRDCETGDTYVFFKEYKTA
jgi:hypothetical protein